MFRTARTSVRVLLVHPGGPFWSKRDVGAWTIPKGEPAEGEGLEQTARREFLEETGVAIEGPMIDLGSVQQKAGKAVHGWAVEGDLDATQVRSNTFEMEWPPRSGRMRTFPEIDRAAWFGLEVAAVKINPGQRELLERLRQMLRPS